MIHIEKDPAPQYGRQQDLFGSRSGPGKGREGLHYPGDIDPLGTASDTGAALETAFRTLCLGQVREFPQFPACGMLIVGLDQQGNVKSGRAGGTAVAAGGAGDAE